MGSIANNQDSLDGDSQGSDIWSSILDSVANSKITPIKNVFLLGEPNSGKTTFLNFLKQENRIRDKLPFKEEQTPTSYEEIAATASEENYFKYLDKKTTPKLAYSHSFVELKDEDTEDVMARINVYRLSEHNDKLHEIMKLGLNYNNYKDSAIVIFLDWAKPWDFLNQLLKWIRILEVTYASILDYGGDPRTIDDPNRWTSGKALLDELKEKMAIYFQEFKDPSKAGGNEGPSELSESFDRTANVINLPDGCLSRNLGIPIIIVCSKADKIKHIERIAEYDEKHFDFIQHTLRSIALMYGATLIFTSTQRPDTFSLLRNYLLHRLFSVPLTNTNQNIEASNITSASSILPLYLNHFKVKGRFMERERVFIPSGWDSFNKIRILDSSFDFEAVQMGFELDLLKELKHYLPPHLSLMVKNEDDFENINQLSETYSITLPVPFSVRRRNNEVQDVNPEPEQQFLAAHYTMFQGLDSSNFFNNQLPYVGTIGLVDKGSRLENNDLKNDNNGAENGSGNSFFKMLAMKDSTNN